MPAFDLRRPTEEKAIARADRKRAIEDRARKKACRHAVPCVRCPWRRRCYAMARVPVGDE